MKEIMDNIKGREWDWFNVRRFQISPKTERHYEIEDCVNGRLLIANATWMYSLADLLANKSWCKAQWGEEWGYFSASNNGSDDWIGKDTFSSQQKYRTCSDQAFKILQQEGYEAAKEFIKKTMLK